MYDIQARLDEFDKEWQKKMQDLDMGLSSARIINRDIILRVTILSASIVGFSISLFSVPVLQSNLNLDIIKVSWYLLLATIIAGFLLLLLEGRVLYGKAWKSFQTSEFPKDLKNPDYSRKERIFATIITVLTLVYPTNLWANKYYESEGDKKYNARVNSLVVGNLAAIEHFLVFFELLFFTLFVIGLISLVRAVKI